LFVKTDRRERRPGGEEPRAAGGGFSRPGSLLKLDAEVVAALVRRGRVSPAVAARTGVEPSLPGPGRLPQVESLIRSGVLDGPEVARFLIELNGVVDFDTAGGIAHAPRLLRLVPRDLAAQTPLLPTTATRGGIVLVLAGRALTQDEIDRLAALLEAEAAILPHPPEALRRAVDGAYHTGQARGFHSMRLGEILARDGRVSHGDLERARKRAREERRRLGEVLVEEGLLDEEGLFRILAAQRRLPLTTASEVLAIYDPSLLKVLSPAYLKHNRVVPYSRDGAAVRVVTSDPLYSDEMIAHSLGAEVRLELVTPGDLERILVAVTSTEERTEGPDANVLATEDEPPSMDSGVPLVAGERHHYEQLADRLLASAIKERASDLHLETYDGEVVSRLRIDGVLRDFREFPLTVEDLRGIINVTKVRSGLDISERRLPQGGRMRRRTAEGALYDFRVQTQPSLQGEHLIVRLLAHSAPQIPLEDLGFAPALTATVHRLVQSAGGLVVISGPTGSGKTTTLYAILDRLRSSGELKIVTAEDPVEYALPRVQQCQVHPEIGYTFANATRAFLRQDPDVILVGETRDLDTAVETIRASQTGHLVLTTLHANDAVNSIRRLIDIGLDAASVSSELLAVLAQRLVRRVCDGCRSEIVPPAELVRDLWPLGAPPGLLFTRGRGCARCRATGYLGRMTLGELWETGEATRDAIARGAHTTELRDLAARLGMRSLMDDACEKIAAGATTVEESISCLPYAAIAYRRERMIEAAARSAPAAKGTP